MFERFLRLYGPVGGARPSEPWRDPILTATPGYVELVAKVAGMTLGGGILRIYGQDEGPKAQRLIREAFPEFASRAVPFARDWLGSMFAVDRARCTNDGVPQLLVLEPGSGDAFEIDEGFAEFFNVDLAEDPNTYLASEFFQEWRSAGGQVPGPGQCVGFKQPLFLGGEGSVDNLEISDLEVYWGLCGQLRALTKGMPPGTPIGGVNS